MCKKTVSLIVVLSVVFSMVFQGTVYVNATEYHRGDGWGAWSDYVDDDTVVIYPVEGGNLYFGQLDSEWFDVDETKIQLISADSTIESANIPPSINGLVVDGIKSDYLFVRCTSLKSVHFPDTIKYVYGSCFMGCVNLEEVFVSAGNPFCYTIDGVLYTKRIDDSNKEHVSLQLFPAKKEGEHFSIPDGVAEIDWGAFCDASNLKSVSIPDSVTHIYDSSFVDLEGINIEDIYFEGTEEQWANIGGYADVHDSLMVHFERYQPFPILMDDVSAWNSIYYNFIRQDKASAKDSNNWAYVDYELIYLDDDNVPELWITYQYGASGCRLVSIQNGAIVQTLLSMGYIAYNEYSNIFYHGGGSFGHYFDAVYTLSDGLLSKIAEGRSVVTWSDDATDSIDYYWQDSRVTEQVYNDNLNSFVDEKAIKETNSEGNTQYNYDEILDYLLTVEITKEDDFKENGLVIYSDYSNLNIRKGSTITLTAGILTDGECSEDVSGINFQIEDTSILKMSTTDIKDNYRYVKLKGLAEGTTTVTFTDSNTGYTATVPIIVYDDNYLSYTLNSVPTQNIEKYPTNIYNVNGLFVDSYEYTVNDDKSATVSFDVYNTNYIYGVVEVFDENGNMKDAVLIEKMTSSNTSIKEALWDNIGYLVRDIVDGDLLSYRQESGYSKKTSVSVKIPKNGYIKITTDPDKSLIVGLINSVDGLMSMASLAGDIKDFDVNSKEFSQKLTKKLLADQVYVELIKDGSDASKKLWKNVGKETFITSESMGNFTDTITKNIDELKLGSIIADTAADFGWNIGENVFTYFSGPAGTALNIIFTIGKVENIIIQQNDLTQSSGVGSIYIQNQGGGFRACQQIKVESDDSLSSDTALSVFTATLDSAILDVIKDLKPEIYEAMSDGITRTYNISLIKSGKETQPNGKVTVYIPISEDFKALAYAGDLTRNIKIYRVEEDGGLTEMDVKIDDGCFVFTTEHFSLYTVVGYDFENTEIQSDEKINISLIIGVASFTVVVIGSIGIILFKRKRSQHK